MAEEDATSTIRPDLPTGGVKKIMKLDRDINKVNSEALLLVTCSAQLFLESLAERSAQVATEKKRKTVKLDQIRIAVKRHRPTSDFLLDSLPAPAQSANGEPADKLRSRPVAGKPVPAGTRRIDDFFGKPVSEVS
ncbi:uncharacterized protein LOC115672000 [Syzygium oleosum]|uniref:uncharacterized protein LOC115672000 n=1 Tax=Syzygium oleosum TaxID=219896 RepID=UPI0024B879DB|nr:uncharacterized protein LOC115672000 [Syzygium oleosum]